MRLPRSELTAGVAHRRSPPLDRPPIRPAATRWSGSGRRAAALTSGGSGIEVRWFSSATGCFGMGPRMQLERGQMASIWDERFADEGYVYGTAPNSSAGGAGGQAPGGEPSLARRRRRAQRRLAGHPAPPDRGRGRLERRPREGPAACRGARGDDPGHVADLATWCPRPPRMEPWCSSSSTCRAAARLVHARAEAALAPGPADLRGLHAAPARLRAAGRAARGALRSRALRQLPGIAWEILRERIELDEGGCTGQGRVVRGLGRRTGAPR